MRGVGRVSLNRSENNARRGEVARPRHCRPAHENDSTPDPLARL